MLYEYLTGSTTGVLNVCTETVSMSST